MHNTHAQADAIVVVSGLPRSGTSLMMAMLAAGGIPPLTDGQRRADVSNPKGYYEYERVKKLPAGDAEWLAEARNRAVKVISALLQHLPAQYTYRVLFMQRRMQEVLASQRRMLLDQGQPVDDADDAELALAFERHLARVQAWLAQQPNMQVLYVNYNALIADPAPHVAAVNRFLGGGLDEAAMIQAIDPSLYRQRA
ncbi:MAG: sulfotransferase [Thermoflexales bacterium]|nr:sulfotransferase [Thermoflexales bacterium]